LPRRIYETKLPTHASFLFFHSIESTN
jgi:hypothetical protein